MLNVDYLVPHTLLSLYIYTFVAPILQGLLHKYVEYLTEGRTNLWDKYKYIGFFPKRIWDHADFVIIYFTFVGVFLIGGLVVLGSYNLVKFDVFNHLNVSALALVAFWLFSKLVRKVLSISNTLNNHLKDKDAHKE